MHSVWEFPTWAYTISKIWCDLHSDTVVYNKDFAPFASAVTAFSNCSMIILFCRLLWCMGDETTLEKRWQNNEADRLIQQAN